MATLWTEEGISAGSITNIDHYPLWVMKDDSWEFYPETNVKKIYSLVTIKFRLDTCVDYIKAFCTASNATVRFKAIQESNVVEASKVVTTEEGIKLQVDIRNMGFSNGEAEWSLQAQGQFYIKDLKVMAFYLAGWTEGTAPTTTWTEEVIT